MTEGVVREGEDTEDITPAQQHEGVHQRIDLTLDAAGGARTEITGIKTAATPIELNAEMEFRDPNGETQTVSNQTTIWPSKRLVGISIPDWVAASDKPKVHVAVVDDYGKPLVGTPVSVTLFSRKRYGYRKRLIGGFYAYENITDTRRIGELCSGNTDSHGLLLCEAKTGVTGEVVAQAAVSDDAGHASSAFAEFYIPGDDRFVFRGHDDDRMDVSAGKAAIPAGRYGALPGADAVRRGHRAGHRRARGRHRGLGADAFRQRPEHHAAGARLRPQRVCLGAGGARKDRLDSADRDG